MSPSITVSPAEFAQQIPPLAKTPLEVDAGQHLTILVVDDVDLQRLIVKRALSKLGHEIVEADSAEQALALVGTRHIDLIVSDWVMEGMDGTDLCHSLRAREDARYIYFILMSSRDGREDILAGMQSGADDFLRKPLDVDELGVRIRAGQRVLDLQSRLEARNTLLVSAYSQIQDDIDAAGSFQLALLPHSDSAGDRLGVSWLFLPSNLVSGDALNFFAIDDTRLAFYLMDVAGHGVASAMVAMNVAQYLNPSIEGCIYECAPDSQERHALDPATTVTRLNQRLCSQEADGKYLTCIYGILDRATGMVQMVRAGHPPPVVIDRTGNVREMADEGDFPVALFADAIFSNITFQLDPGDRLCLFSDGITECEGPDGTFFGDQRLQEFLKSEHQTPISRLGDRFAAQIRHWHSRDGEPFRDDVSLLVIEYQPEGVAETASLSLSKE